MPSERKFYRTVFEVEVLSEHPFEPEDLETIAYEITYGGCSGMVDRTCDIEVDAEEMVRLLRNQGSDPDFFMLTDDGDDVDNEACEEA